MKLSEAIVTLQELLAEHGDLDLLKLDETYGTVDEVYDFYVFEVTEEDVEKDETDFEAGYKHIAV